MGFFSNLFKSKARQKQEEQAVAREEWSTASANHDRFEMEQAASSLSIAELHDEYVVAMRALIKRFPDHACNYENDLGIHYWGVGDNERAMKHYIRSYNLDEAGGAAESNILELCRELADSQDDPKVAVQQLLLYFRICTRAVDPSATVEEINATSFFGRKSRPLAEVRLEEAETAFHEIEELLEDIEDPNHVEVIRAELANIARYFGIRQPAR